MAAEKILGLGHINDEDMKALVDLKEGGEGLWRVGVDGVKRILTPLDRKIEFISYSDKTLVYVKSSMG